MTLISTEELNKSISRSFRNAKFAYAVSQLIQTKKINKFYNAHQNDSAEQFIDSVNKKLKLKYEISEEEIKRIPTSGPLIIVSNHPLGGIDGLLLIKTISQVRPDLKMLAHYIFQRINPLKDIILPINPFEKTDRSLSYSGFKQAISHLNKNGAIVVFPAGEIAKYNFETQTFIEGIWQNSILRFVKMLKSPVLPVYLQCNNQNPFIFFSFNKPSLSEEIPSELFNPKNRNVRIRIGKPIPVKEQDQFVDINQYGRFLRVKTKALGNPIEVKKFFKPQFQRNDVPEPIVPPIAQELLIKDIKNLPERFFLFRTNNFKVYCAPSLFIPNVLNEIGRLREETFRDVGEGTSKSTDLDEFDLYYNHLFIWDEEKNLLVGAYRVGMGKDIVNQFGKKGFYIESLFKINNKFIPYLYKSLELGRSFITKDYQQKPMPLFMLWKGILYFLLKHPEYRYLIGPVSISNQFSKMSKALITEFIKTNFYDNEIAELVKPRTKFKITLHDIDTDIINKATMKDINKLDKFIEDIETTNFRLPVLLKKYIKLNAKIICFNIDPKFNDALDGLMLLDLFKVPLETIKSLSKELEDNDILERFYSGDPDLLKKYSQ